MHHHVSLLQFSLMATFPEHILGILLFCGCVMVIGIIQVRRKTFPSRSLSLSFTSSSLTLFFMMSSSVSSSSTQSVIVLYSFSRPFLLNEQIQVSENQTFYKHHILKVIMRVPLMCFIASIFSFIFFQLVGRNTLPIPKLQLC